MEAETAIYTVISLFGLWYIFFVLYPDYCLDRFRQKVFGLRDELFDEVASGNLSFDDKMYGLTRITMNGFIRHAHEINLISFLTGQFFFKDHLDHFGKYQEKYRSALGAVPDEKQKIYRRYFRGMNGHLVRYIFLGSPILAVTIVIPLLLHALLNLCLRQTLEYLEKPLRQADSLAYASGD